VNHASTTTYIKRLRDGELAITDIDDDGDRMRAREYFVFGMRLLDGIDPSVFQRETGFELAALVGSTMARDVSAGFFVNRGGRWQLTETGLAVSDGLWPDYLSEQTEAAADDCIHYA
jgi:oxygen-independent coproporphyrinogen-3 oxidase